MGFHPVRRWQKTGSGGWSDVWHPIRGAGRRFAASPGGGASLPPAIFWHSHAGCGTRMRRFCSPEFVTLRVPNSFRCMAPGMPPCDFVFQPGGLAENSRWQATRRHRKCDPMGFHPVRRWQKTGSGGWSDVWHPIRGAGRRFAASPGGGASLPPAIFWHPHAGCGTRMRRFCSPEFVALRVPNETRPRFAFHPETQNRRNRIRVTEHRESEYRGPVQPESESQRNDSGKKHYSNTKRNPKKLKRNSGVT